jgi:hypothetical protein
VSFSKYDFCISNWNKNEHRCFTRHPKDIIDFSLLQKTTTGVMVLKNVKSLFSVAELKVQTREQG